MFLTTSRSAINLDHVREITWRRPKTGPEETVFHFTDGERVVVGGILEPPGLVIPAAPGFLLAGALPPDGGEDIGCEDEAYDFAKCITLYAIIAWGFEDGFVVPLTVHGRDEYDAYPHAAIVEPSGRVVIPTLQDFDSLAAWTSAVRSTWLLRRQESKKTAALEMQQEAV